MKKITTILFVVLFSMVFSFSAIFDLSQSVPIYMILSLSWTPIWTPVEGGREEQTDHRSYERTGR